ncbi:DUF4259 domain-containing protein [Patulibacter sp. SYSU D01012]|uniref:DUF4259 domain-containing protein n=1 Tax=Patulibacter sp. SYSU D01012 TaxID=2817381 RepID=UPI001B30ABD0|nr:DUF4259 domain-containing protein [Patulibacter sp. SYSU D01012]
MGAWGPGHLENDDAADWLADFEEEPTVAMVTAALEAVVEERGFVDAPLACEALAACEAIAAAVGHPVADGTAAPDGAPSGDGPAGGALPARAGEDHVERLVRLTADLPELVDQVPLALRALPVVVDAGRSELAQLWAEADADDGRSGDIGWLLAVMDVRERLQRVPGHGD